MSPSTDDLGHDARALIRAARGGDDASEDERRQVLESFAVRREILSARERTAGHAHRLPTTALRSRTPRVTWAVAALIFSGSLVALAQQQGLLERLSEAVEDFRGALTPPPSKPPRAVARRMSPPLAVTPQQPPAQQPPAQQPPAQQPPAQQPPAQQPPALDAEPAANSVHPSEPASASAPESPPPNSARRGVSSISKNHPALPTPDPLIRQELDLIAAARSALAQRQFDAARQAAELHGARFPQGMFSEERDAILALSDCRGNRGTQRGQRFIEERPRALHAERIRRDCGLGTNLVPGSALPVTH